MKKILVVFGGRTPEHDVSIVTAHIPIMDALAATGDYEIYPCYVDLDGTWYCQSQFTSMTFFARADWRKQLTKFSPVQLELGEGLTVVWPGLRPKRVGIDVVFPAMHGTYGEDGSLMGLLRMADVPFVGCDLAASAVAMDKVLTKQVASAAGIAVVPYVWFGDADWRRNRAMVLERSSSLTYPLFVKPAHLGSSIGITRVAKRQELENALEVAFHYDDKVLVEEAVAEHIEVTLPVMGNDHPRPALLERPRAGFFTYDEKYLSDGGKKGSGGANSAYSEIPAQLDPKLTERCLEIGLATYRTLGCSGTARIDLLINGRSGKVYLNEVNPLPGSLYHHNWRQAGVSGVELVTELIRLAEERHRQQADKSFVYSSDILQHVSGAKTQR